MKVVYLVMLNDLDDGKEVAAVFKHRADAEEFTRIRNDREGNKFVHFYIDEWDLRMSREL